MAKTVWLPIRKATAAKRFLIIAEGPLLRLPWPALPDADGYLVERDVQFHVLNHERDLFATTARPAPQHALLAVAAVARLCAGAHDFGKCIIRMDRPGAGLEPALQAAGYVGLVRGQHHARIRRPPKDGLSSRIPGKNASGIGRKQAIRSQVAAERQQSIRLPTCAFQRRKIQAVHVQLGQANHDIASR